MELELIPNRKGFFFTVLILVLISLVVISSIFYTTVQERKSVQKRVETLNDFVFSSQKDIERNIYIAAFRFLFIFEKQITDTSNYISNVSVASAELFFNGTLNSIPQSFMEGATFLEIQTALQQNAAKLNIDISLTQPQIILDQTDPWRVRVRLSTRLMLTDASNLAFWNSTRVFESFVPLNTFSDPLYLVNTQGKISNLILPTPFTVFAQGSNVQNLTDHLDNNYYKPSASAPSFLDRLQGSTSPSAQGIESLVDLTALSAQGISVESKSVVDYIYFSSLVPASHQIQNMPSWFRLDDDHLDDYNVTGLVIP